MEKNIKKRVCGLAVLVVAVLVVVSGYLFFFCPDGHWQKKLLEADKTEYMEKRVLWRESETMTMQRMLQDLTLLANGDSVMVCGLTNIPIPVYRDFINGVAQPKRPVWANTRYWYMSAVANGREWMQRMLRDRKCKTNIFWSTSRSDVQTDSTKNYLCEKLTSTETTYNKVYPKLGKPADMEFEEWRKEK